MAGRKSASYKEFRNGLAPSTASSRSYITRSIDKYEYPEKDRSRLSRPRIPRKTANRREF